MNKPSKNKPCPCGSKKLYKRCCIDINKRVSQAFEQQMIKEAIQMAHLVDVRVEECFDPSCPCRKRE